MTADDLLGTVDPDGSDDLGQETPPDDTLTPGTDATPSEPTPAGEPESFVDPATLPPELKPHWKRMHGTFTKRLQEFKSASEQAALVERFNTDPQYAAQVIQARAAQLGITLQGPGQTAPPAQPSSAATQPNQPPAEFIERFRSNLPDNLKWMAESLAPAQWASVQELKDEQARQKAEFEARQAEQAKAQATREYETAEAEMDETFPQWRERESELVELTKFLRSDQIRHPKFGNKLTLVYKAMNAENIGTAIATQRMTQAARSRVTTGTPARTSEANTEEQVRSAKTHREAIRIAAQAAAAQLGLR